jgi:shikimate dehydrogenase
VIGYPIGHSLSPAIHNSALAAEGRDAVYLPFEVENLDAFIRDMAHPRTRRIDWRLRGLSVTIPHKLDVIGYLDEVEPLARRIGAVNTVAIEGERLLGYNTDVMGAMSPLDDVFDVRGARVAVLGAGGAARAVLYGLAERGVETTVYARDLKKAGVLAEEFEARSAALESFAGDTDVVINCTPVGMKGRCEGQSPVRREALDRVKLVYELVYNPEETELL